ncbi:MAG TPA: hypothetical protein VLV48_08270 [Thermoanaerobaculia bacterium]|nr:hypothetical protein [Thermoanaerobaculia bacterium]
MTGFSFRDRDERGFVLISALLISLLFFGLIELALRDTTEAVRGAHRQRARFASEILADNGIELAAAGMVYEIPKNEVRTSRDGTTKGTFRPLPGNRFELRGEGRSAGVAEVETRVVLRGRSQGATIVIEESETR